MRQLVVWTFAALTLGALLAAPAAGASRVLQFDDGRVRARSEPGLRSVPAARLGEREPRTRQRARMYRLPSARSSRKDPVRDVLAGAERAGQIDSATAANYRRIYRDAVTLRSRLPLSRARELGYVIGTVGTLARRGALTAGRMVPLFLILDRNREWWTSKGAPASGARVRFTGSELIFQYYPGRGLQLQPLANFGFANGLWQSHRDERLRSLVDELVALRVSRGGFSAWEYYFEFGGGSPPWVSGMAQATAMQALARASARLEDPALLNVAREGIGAFERGTPVGVRVASGPGAWYALYSFAPGLQVLNGMLQALIGLDTYADYAGDPRGVAAFAQGDNVASARIQSYDTGAWSLYSRSPTSPGAEADLNYHKLNRDFARRLCRMTGSLAYCTAAEHFSAYLTEDPSLEPLGPRPAPAIGGSGVRFQFTLSKVGRVGITVREAESGRTYLSTSAAFRRGRHFFRWVPPRLRREHTYEYSLTARDLAGNASSETGTLRVKGR